MHALALVYLATFLAPANGTWAHDTTLGLPERGEPATHVSDPPQPASPPFGATGLALGGHLGIATPYGGAGVALDARLTDHFAIEAGLGLGIGGPQLAGMFRLRFPANGGALTLGTGLSTGPFSADGTEGLFAMFSAMSHDNPGRTEWDLAHWSNTELSAETNAGSALVRGYLGYGAVLNDYDRCDQHGDPDAACEGDIGLIYLGVSVGLLLL